MPIMCGVPVPGAAARDPWNSGLWRKLVLCDVAGAAAPRLVWRDAYTRRSRAGGGQRRSSISATSAGIAATSAASGGAPSVAA